VNQELDDLYTSENSLIHSSDKQNEKDRQKSLEGTWSHALREEQTLEVFENKVLRSVSGPEGDIN
jgi:hypothetical protein